MKYILIGVIVIALIAAGFWAGKKSGGNQEATATPTSSNTITFVPTLSPSALPLTIKGESEGVVGNRPGNLAPDFRLKDMEGRDVSLRDYLGREAIKLEFRVANQVVLVRASVPQGITLRDPNQTVYRLYAVPSMPYTVTIDDRGIIR